MPPVRCGEEPVCEDLRGRPLDHCNQFFFSRMIRSAPLRTRTKSPLPGEDVDRRGLERDMGLLSFDEVEAGDALPGQDGDEGEAGIYDDP